MQNKGDKKLTVTTKGMASKKPSLEIKIPHQNDQANTAPHTFSTFKDDKAASKCPTISTVTSPTHFKNIHPISEIPQSAKESPKRKVEPLTIQKRGSGKETPSPKVQIQPRMAATQLGSPKAAFQKEKVLISYGSEKNLNNIKALERKETPRRTHNKIEELQRMLNDQKIITSTLANREEQLSKQNDTLKKQNNALKDQVAELKKKIERFKVSNEETKKMLKERISSFNEEGGQLKVLREQVQTLEARVNSLLSENQTLQAELNKYDCENLSFVKDIRNQYAVSMVKEIVPLSGSRIGGQYLKESEDGDDFKVFEGMEGMDEDLDLQSYITEKEESYLQQYKANVSVFEKIKQEYEQILSGIELRYKNLCQDYEATIASQAAEIYDLQLKIDELRQEQKGGNMLDSKLSLDVDEAILRAQDEIAKQSLTIYDLKAANRQLISEVQQKSAQHKFLQAELEVAALKGRFKDQNDRFEYNVAKLNLLNIIDKLKLRVDREKVKYENFKARVSSVN